MACFFSPSQGSEHTRLRKLLDTHILPPSLGEVQPMTTTDSDLSVEAIGREDPGVTSRVPLPVDPRRARFPCCVVWSPLPVISWLVPFVGHLGICTEDGVILDFAGSYFISVDAFTFGATSRYVRLNPEQVPLSPCCQKPGKTGTKFLGKMCRNDHVVHHTALDLIYLGISVSHCLSHLSASSRVACFSFSERTPLSLLFPDRCSAASLALSQPT